MIILKEKGSQRCKYVKRRARNIPALRPFLNCFYALASQRAKAPLMASASSSGLLYLTLA